MDNLLKILERAGNDLLQADEYLARVGLRTMPEPRNSKSQFGEGAHTQAGQAVRIAERRTEKV